MFSPLPPHSVAGGGGAVKCLSGQGLLLSPAFPAFRRCPRSVEPPVRGLERQTCRGVCCPARTGVLLALLQRSLRTCPAKAALRLARGREPSGRRPRWGKGQWWSFLSPFSCAFVVSPSPHEDRGLPQGCTQASPSPASLLTAPRPACVLSFEASFTQIMLWPGGEEGAEGWRETGRQRGGKGGRERALSGRQAGCRSHQSRDSVRSLGSGRKEPQPP